MIIHTQNQNHINKHQMHIRTIIRSGKWADLDPTHPILARIELILGWTAD